MPPAALLELELALDELDGGADALAEAAEPDDAAVLEAPPVPSRPVAVLATPPLAELDELLDELELELLLDVPPELDDEHAAVANAATVTIANSWVFLRVGQRDIGVSIWIWRRLTKT